MVGCGIMKLIKTTEIYDMDEIKRQYCKEHMWDYSIAPIIVRAFHLNLLDVRKMYIWMRCKEVFGKRRYRRVPITKSRLINISKINYKKKYTYTIQKKIVRYDNHMKTSKIKALSEEVGLKRARLYDYAQMENVSEIINREEFFYLYCIGHIFDEEYFNMLFQKRKWKVNRFSDMAKYINKYPVVEELEITEDEQKKVFDLYTEDAIEKYLRKIEGCTIEIDENGEVTEYSKTIINERTGCTIDDDYTNCIFISIFSFADDEKIRYIYDEYSQARKKIYEEKDISLQKKTIKDEDVILNFCKMIRNCSKRNKNTTFIIEEYKENDADSKSSKKSECINRRLAYLSAFIENVFIVQNIL